MFIFILLSIIVGIGILIMPEVILFSFMSFAIMYVLTSLSMEVVDVTFALYTAMIVTIIIITLKAFYTLKLANNMAIFKSFLKGIGKGESN